MALGVPERRKAQKPSTIEVEKVSFVMHERWNDYSLFSFSGNRLVPSRKAMMTRIPMTGAIKSFPTVEACGSVSVSEAYLTCACMRHTTSAPSGISRRRLLLIFMRAKEAPRMIRPPLCHNRVSGGAAGPRKGIIAYGIVIPPTNEVTTKPESQMSTACQHFCHPRKPTIVKEGKRRLPIRRIWDLCASPAIDIHKESLEG